MVKALGPVHDGGHELGLVRLVAFPELGTVRPAPPGELLGRSSRSLSDL